MSELFAFLSILLELNNKNRCQDSFGVNEDTAQEEAEKTITFLPKFHDEFCDKETFCTRNHICSINITSDIYL